jgi:hypothetical protein
LIRHAGFASIQSWSTANVNSAEMRSSTRLPWRVSDPEPAKPQKRFVVSSSLTAFGPFALLFQPLGRSSARNAFAEYFFLNIPIEAAGNLPN